jgi:hypothetical protein
LSPSTANVHTIAVIHTRWSDPHEVELFEPRIESAEMARVSPGTMKPAPTEFSRNVAVPAMT